MHLPEFEALLPGLQRFAWWTLAAAPLVAWLGAWWVRKRLTQRGLSARTNMPSLPSREADDARPARRFDRNVQRTLGRVLPGVLRQPLAVEAAELARRLGEDPELVQAALDRLRAAVPCRMQVTGDGRILYDFRMPDLQRLRRNRVLAWPARVLWLLLGLIVNVGAAWPLFASVVIGGVTLERMLQATDDMGRVLAGLMGLGAILAAFAIDWLAGHAVALLVHPGLKSPRLVHAEAQTLSARSDRVRKARAKRELDQPDKAKSKGKFDWRDLAGGLEFAGEGCVGGLIVILVALVVAAIAGALVGIWLWMRGLWHALARPEPPHLDVAPGVWVRDGKSMERWAALVPTTDLAVALLRALREGLRAVRPGDRDLPRRVLGLAQRQGGGVSALDIALQEAVDLDEAVRIGARLAGLHGGEVRVTESGDIDFTFAFPHDQGLAPAIEPPPYEALPRDASEVAHSVRVNVPGLTLSHLRAADRLAGGTLVTAGLLVMAAQALATRGMLRTGEALDIALPILTAGVFAVVGATRALAQVQAGVGMRRDVRRATLALVRRGLADRTRYVDAPALTAELFRALRQAWPALELETVRQEVQNACTDLDLELDSGVMVRNPDARLYGLGPLAQRLLAIEAHRLREAEAPRALDPGVVFDTGWADEP